MSPRDEPFVGQRVGRFRVLARLGQGGLATVWKAHDHLLGRPVALKILDSKLANSTKVRRRFLHEAQAAAALDHPSIVTVYDTGESEGLVYIALSLVEGETLSERVGRRLMPIPEAIRIVIEAADALGHAHARGVVHRDVTGRNIMIGNDGRVFMLDFGLALASWESRVTTTETAVGTAPYMAPEVIRGETADARSDLYGLGVVLYEALTGAFPFPGERTETIMYTVLNAAPIRPRERRPGIPTRLELVVLKAIARDPGERYPSAGDIIEALRATDRDPAPLLDGPSKPGQGVSAATSRIATPPEATTVQGRPDPLYLAVLSFDVDDPKPDAEDTCRAVSKRLADVLSHALSGSLGVRVIPPPRAPVPAEPREVADQLGANALLKGVVRREGLQLRVSYAVTDPWRGTHIAGDVVSGSTLRTFALEDDVVASVARSLDLTRSSNLRKEPTRPKDPAAHERYLQALANLKRFNNDANLDGAIGILNQLIASEGDIATYHAALARAFLYKHQLTRHGSWESRAASACERARNLDPGAPEVRVALGDLYVSTGRPGDALVEFDHALEERPDWFEALLGKGRALEAGDRHADAEAVLRRLISIQPDDWRGHHWLGAFLFGSNRYDEAAEEWKRVVELTPDNAIGRMNLGLALFRLDRFEQAMEAFRSSIEIQPRPEAFSNLGSVLFSLGRHDEAVASSRKATELNPMDYRWWGNYGLICRWAPGHEDEEARALERAIALMREHLDQNPADGPAWGRMAGWMANLGQGDQALHAVQKALELAPGDTYCMVRAGHVHFQLGDRPEALRWLREAVRGGYGVGELQRSKEFAPLKDDPEFRRMLEEGAARMRPDHDTPT